ncbi:PAS-domain containing protein [Sphingomonas naphthae]|uniref:histidine kinase n=1 Tax=Sphingomonas naphthae TaxID=1813468 RepID=A0ABY7TKF5_9SPHN|nr:NahK/ErcS family hybrid sensor histidine kinase/response regulator [Sphingomonas naphthae]WCT73197.1 PAS-domain containing protein [Sphingomonas naphthae]
MAARAPSPPAPISADAARLAELTRENEKLRRINAALMDRVERSTDLQGNAFSLFETAITLEAKVRDRTGDLEQALTELAQSNAALVHARDSADAAERRLRDAIESINEGFALFDAEDRLILFNQTYLGLWPHIADRIVPGMRFDEIAAMVRDEGSMLGQLVAPDRWVSERLAQHLVAEGGHVHALADGRWVQINELRTSDGGIVGVYTDITEAKAEDARAQARSLAEKSAVLQATLDAIWLGVCVYDRDRRLIAWNDALLPTIGLPIDGIAGIVDHAGLAKAVEVVDAPARRSLAWLPEGMKPVVAKCRHADGRVIEVRRSAMPGGGMVMSFEDITERLAAARSLRESNETLERRVEMRTADIAAVNTRLQQEVAERLAAEDAMRGAMTAAEQANLSKTRFLAAASHDLLQPLNAARLFVSALGDRRLAQATRALVRQTGSALDSVEDLLEALLEISKLDAGAVTPEIGDFPLDGLLASMRAEFGPMARESGIRLKLRESDRWIRSDQRVVRRILQNFISNALRYTEEGEVSVRCVEVGDQLRIEVRDTGPGIPPEHHATIFEEFRRLAPASKRERGMGLGLAIVQRAATMLGHRIGLESAVGEGSTFSITVPLGRPAASTPRLPAANSGGQLDGLPILIVDNEHSILSGMTAMLTGWNCKVGTATGLEEARERLAAGCAPRLLLADYHLDEGATGDAVVREIRADLGQDIPAVIITADRTPELREELERAGFFVLTKPVKPAQLRALLSSAAG